MSVEFHRQRRGFAWRSCKVRLGPVRLMFCVAEGEGSAPDWASVSATIGRRYFVVQKHGSRWIGHRA